MRLPRNRRRFWLSVLILGFFFIVSVAVAGTVYVVLTIRSLPTPDQFSTREVSQSTKIYDRTGTVLLYEIHGQEKRTVIQFSDIPDYVKEATVAVEDASFYTRPAIDVLGIARAMWADILAGKFVQGGSTITQQLARNMFLSPQKTIDRKIREVILAFELEAKYSKSQILDFYLNQIPYGSNAYGVEAASQTYFGKPAKDLDLAESAIIASLPQAPSYYSPWGDNLSELITRQHYVLDRMTQLGYITQAQADQAKAEKLDFAPQSLGTIKAPHFVMAVEDYLINKYGEDEVMNGGLKVITTLDWPMEQAAEQSVTDGVARNLKLYNSDNGALMAEDPTTGQILALVGSADYFDQSIDGNFDMPLQGLRQPGSSLKPFVYLKALEDGYPPNTVVFDVPTEFNPNCPATPNFNVPNQTAPNGVPCFHPQDFDNFQGPITFEQALPQSINVAAVKVLYLVGIQNVLDELKTFGITTLNNPNQYGLSLVLGGGAVKMVDMLKAYSILSQEGVAHQQTMVLSVQDANGNTLESYHDQANRVADPKYIRWINYILSSTALRAPLFGYGQNLTDFPGYDVALKTGTSNDYRDAWAFGYTPNLVVGVWAGNTSYAPMQRKGSSILAAVPMWSAFLKQVLPTYQPELFTSPEPLPPVTKPMLDGSYVADPSAGGITYPQVHSLIYYVNKDDPLGAAPQDPGSDPQFANWEAAALNWASQNIPNFSTYNQPVPPAAWGQLGQPSNITFGNLYPTSGIFATSPLEVRSAISAPAGLKAVEIDLNGAPLKTIAVSGTDYSLDYIVTTPLVSQNLITIKATDTTGASNSVNIIVYH